MNLNSGIGGFLELEGNPYSFYPDAVELNSGRNALRYIIRVNSYSSLAIPRYICPAVPQALKNEGCRIVYYSIDENLCPLDVPQEPIPLLYVNYFGLKSKVARHLSLTRSRLILDNSQSFFFNSAGIDALYSPRKFFGVPDGGYAIVNDKSLSVTLEQDCSNGRCCHLLQRAEGDLEQGYSNFLLNEVLIESLPLQTMSVVTKRLLSMINYMQCAQKRRENFAVLHDLLGALNMLSLKLEVDDVPLVYPLLLPCDSSRAKEKLLHMKIFIPTFWSGMLETENMQAFERSLESNLLPLPLDHRYSREDVANVAKCVIASL